MFAEMLENASFLQLGFVSPVAADDKALRTRVQSARSGEPFTRDFVPTDMTTSQLAAVMTQSPFNCSILRLGSI